MKRNFMFVAAIAAGLAMTACSVETEGLEDLQKEMEEGLDEAKEATEEATEDATNAVEETTEEATEAVEDAAQ